jgi:succinoglycan biosynthesis transport protein ExoP
VNSPANRTDAPSLTLSDVYHILFRRKFTILACSLAGIGAAIALYFTSPPPYQSEAKLFIRYVAEAKAPAPAASAATAKSPDQRGETILDSEMEIITSWDLARNVAKAVGPAIILGAPAGADDLNRAAAAVKANLVVDAPPRSSVIHLTFKHPNPGVVQRVLREVIDQYLRVHLEIHSAIGMVGNFLNQETVQLRTRLAQTDEALRRLRNQAGVLSIEDTKKSYTDQLASIQLQIFAAQAELAERRAVLRELQKQSPAPAAAPEAAAQPSAVPADRRAEYAGAVHRLDILRRMEQELLTQYREENSRVQDIRAQLVETEKTCRTLETAYPQLSRASAMPAPADGSQAGNAIDAATVRLSALESRLQTLNSQYAEIQTKAAGLDAVEASIVDLRRTKELEESNYRYYAASLEQARIDEALGAGHVSNISEIQTPSPPSRDRVAATRLLALICGAGVAFGFGWAFVTELWLDRTVKQPADIEKLFHPSLFLAIPSLGKMGRVNGSQTLAPTALQALLPFHDTLRNRLSTYFESKGLHHKPKMVALTGVGIGAGVSTTAAGLARSLSEIGEGKVLLIDMTIGQASARQFIPGDTACDLDQVFETCEPAKVQSNLFVIADNPKADLLTRRMPQRFSRLVPRLKASDFDYVIFDLPAVSPTSITPRLAGFMDMVLLVVQAEATDQDVLQRATDLLAESTAPIGVVLNQTRSHVPQWLKPDFAHGH